ncbi:MAG: hypothetical protein K1060chlam2_00503 [Chlamydiae bacterium]|nr:hypothetical protein [Chlamydiota bacterium]
MRQTVALFGEAEKGEISSLFFVNSLTHLNEVVGNPPDESRGISFAIQFLLYEQDLIYIRVKEEGFSTKDYLKGMKNLLNRKRVSHLSAICLPGVGDGRIIDSATPVQECYKALMITSESDLYDYLTSLQLESRSR